MAENYQISTSLKIDQIRCLFQLKRTDIFLISSQKHMLGLFIRLGVVVVLFFQLKNADIFYFFIKAYVVGTH